MMFYTILTDKLTLRREDEIDLKQKRWGKIGQECRNEEVQYIGECPK